MEQMEILAKIAEGEKTEYIRDYLIAHYNLSRWEGARLLIGFDGREIEIASLFDDPEAEFITNERVVYLAEQYEKMAKREKSLLTEKGGAPLRARQTEPCSRS